MYSIYNCLINSCSSPWNVIVFIAHWDWPEQLTKKASLMFYFSKLSTVYFQECPVHFRREIIVFSLHSEVDGYNRMAEELRRRFLIFLQWLKTASVKLERQEQRLESVVVACCWSEQNEIFKSQGLSPSLQSQYVKVLQSRTRSNMGSGDFLSSM